jgi:hypothetical protein
MNKMYSILAALFLSITAFAAERPKSSRLTIATNDNTAIRVEIDGRRYSENDNTVRINNITAGYHSIQVYSRQQSSGIFGRNSERLIYSTNMYVKPEHRVDILIDRSGRARIQESDLGRKGRNRNNRDRDDDRWEDYENWQRDNDRYDNRNDRYDRNDDKWNQRPDRNYGRAISNAEFQSIKQSLRRESFDNNRLSLAKQIIDRNPMETSQVKELMYLFSFESNRLDLAKYAYRNTVDKNNYYSLYDAFSFSSSKDELSRFINSYR